MKNGNSIALSVDADSKLQEKATLHEIANKLLEIYEEKCDTKKTTANTLHSLLHRIDKNCVKV